MNYYKKSYKDYLSTYDMLTIQKNFSSYEYTMCFADRFLVYWPTARSVTENMFCFMVDAYNRIDSSLNKIPFIIKKLPYDFFLYTWYWRLISEHVKFTSCFQCSNCWNPDSPDYLEIPLHVHHPDYSFHGEEITNIDKLVCLCEDCHKKEHNL